MEKDIHDKLFDTLMCLTKYESKEVVAKTGICFDDLWVIFTNERLPLERAEYVAKVFQKVYPEEWQASCV